MVRKGIELGIEAPMEAFFRAKAITDSESVDYLFVPETNPDIFGVDALKTLYEITSWKGGTTRLGTGIVSIFSRDVDRLKRKAQEIYDRSGGRFVLGIGASTKFFADSHGRRFEKPLKRMREYTLQLKSTDSFSVYWAAVGDRMNYSAGMLADGVVYFMKPENELKRSISQLKDPLEKRRVTSRFNTVSIRPVYMEDWEKARDMAALTIAKYVNGNEAYRHGLEREGFGKEVDDIVRYGRSGLEEMAKKVSDKMVKSLVTYGTPRDCAKEIDEYAKRTGIKTVLAGFDLPRSQFDSNFFKSLKEFAGYLK